MEEFETGHNDRVTVLHVNFDGSKILTASIDHRVKVWNRDKSTGERKLLDTFTAHDADIRDAKFLHPTTGTNIATIGNDLKFHLWTEDPSQAPNSGRRFRRISTISSTPRVPFVSLDLKTVEYTSTYLALIDRQGLLSIFEPTNPDEFKDWTLLDQLHVCDPPPARGEETSFKVRFDPNSPPLAYINSLSDDQNQLSLVVTALKDVKIYRSSPLPNQNHNHKRNSNSNNNNNINYNQDLPSPSSQNDNPTNTNASHRLMFYESIKFPTHPNLVRDVSWSSFNIRGVDRIATACKDGSIRIFELSINPNPENINNGYNNNNINQSTWIKPNLSTKPQSSLTSAITGISQHNQSTSSTSNTNSPPINSNHSTRESNLPFSFLTVISHTAILSNVHEDVWSVSFDSQGQILMSGGNDGITKIWRRSVMTNERGKWLLFADQAVEFDDENTTQDGSTNGEGDDDGVDVLLGGDGSEDGGIDGDDDDGEDTSP